MTDAQNKLKLQHAHATNVLNYGQLGTATYVEHLADWAFLRAESGRATHDQAHAAPAFPFERIGLEADAFQSSIHGQTADLEAHRDIASTHNTLRLVPEAFCEITKRQHSHGANAQSNDSSTEAALRPSQLAFGGAAAVLNNGTSRQTIPVVAIVSGSNFEAVRILLIGKESFQTTDIRESLQKYQLPKVTYDEEGYWIGEGDPVQQVCFAAACDFETTQSAWMAARCRSATTIFHPLFHRTQMTFDSSATRLSPNPILRISISRTGGYPHADVAFHLRDHKILAIVDVRGNWSVWKIDIPRHSFTGQVLFGAHLQSVGRLLTDIKLLSLQGDWHRICWMGCTPHESDNLLVSSHSHAALFDYFGHNLGALDLRTGGTEDGQMILDIAKSTTNPTHCYILTSTKILLMSAAENDWTDSTGQKRMTMILSWSHYRGRADLSLTLMLAETAQATTILITSSNNSIVTACRTGLILEKSPTPVSLVDPFHFDLLKSEKIGEQRNAVRMLAFRHLQIHSRASLTGDDDPVLFKAFLGRPGNRLDEILYRCTDAVASSTFRRPHSTAIPFPMIRTLQRKSEKYADLEDAGDFIVTDETTTWVGSSERGRPLFRISEESVESAPSSATMMDWKDMYTMLVDLEVAPPNETRLREVAMAIKELHLQLERQVQPPTTIRTVKELLGVRPLLNDFEAATRAFTSLTIDLLGIEDQQLQISQLDVPGSRPVCGSLSDLHDQLKASWVLPLPRRVDNKTRLAKDRLARSVTADLALSNITVGPVPAIVEEAVQVQQQDARLSDLTSSPPSTITSANELEAEDPACARLRKYGVLKKHITTISTSRLLTDILAHLPTDTDANPSTYNWRATEARLAAGHSAEGAEKIDPKARRKAERLAASQRKRLEAQKQISQAVEQMSAPPMIISSHFPVVREVQSSQVGPSTRHDQESSVPPPMTQPVRGTFGSRVARTGKVQVARKKGRKQGF